MNTVLCRELGQCGRGGATIRLAPDGGVSAYIFIGCEIAIGGKPPPTVTEYGLGDRQG